MSKNGISFTLKVSDQMLIGRGLGPGGLVQLYVDNEVVRRTDAYVPFDTGRLRASVRANNGTITYATAYAARQYYTNKGRGLRGPYWFDRMKADHLHSILQGAAALAGARAERYGG